MKKYYSGLCWGVVLGLFLLERSGTASLSTPHPGEDYVAGEVVVKFQKSVHTQASALIDLSKLLGKDSIQSVRPFITDTKLAVLKLSNQHDVVQALSVIRSVPAIEYAEPNFIYHAQAAEFPNDPDFKKTWGMKNQVNPGVDINILPLWTQGFYGSRNIVVAVIDSGVDWNHPELVPNLYTNPAEAGELANNGIDDDFNGFVDDVHGWNFYGGTNNSKDDYYHGTHVAGTIGAVGNNGSGVAGVVWEVSLMPVKFLSSAGGGSLEGAVNAINYATQMNVNIMNNSWGGARESLAVREAIERARDAGILFVAAAGNNSESNESYPFYPATYPVSNIVSVAATTNQDKLASFSNFGAKTVHVAAPGEDVYSTTPEGRYMEESGTSMATPHVAGIAALLMAIDPSLTWAEIKDRLIKTSDPVSALKGKVMADGRVNAHRAFLSHSPRVPAFTHAWMTSEWLVLPYFSK